MSQRESPPARRLVITVCPREPGTVLLPVERGERRRRLSARRILEELESLVERRGLTELVHVREGCAGGCHGPGPNVSVTLHAVPPPGRPPDNISIGWRTYVGSIGALDCLAAIVDESLGIKQRAAGARRGAPPTPHMRPGP